MSGRWWLVLGAGIAAVGASVAVQVFSDAHDPVSIVRIILKNGWVDLGNGALWLAGGLIAWQRRPSNRVGPLMTIVGFALLAPWVLIAGGAPGFTLAALLDELAPAIAAHLFLAFPLGYLATRPERIVITMGYLVATLLQGAELLVRDFAAAGCGDCPSNLLLVHSEPALADALVLVIRAAALGVAASLVVILARRWRAASAAARRTLAPVLWSSLLAALVFAVSYGTQTPYQEPELAMIPAATVGLVPVAFLVGLLRTRLHRGAVGDLVVALGRPHRPAELRDMLARALGDPSLELAFWLPDARRYVDAEGRPIALPQGEAGRGVSLISHDGATLAALSYDASLLDDEALVDGVAAVARLALENSRLQAELRARLREVHESRTRIVAAADAERRRIERNLHDGAQQTLLAVRLAVRLARNHAGDNPDVLDAQLAEIDSELKGALEELRALAHGLHPPVLTEEGLEPALATLARRATIPVEVTCRCPQRLAAPVEIAAYYVAAEALANVIKHAHAASVRIDVALSDGQAVIEVADDGRGGADPHGSGLRGLSDRIAALDGTLELDSDPTTGTRLRAEIPCA